eukprot:4561609-Pyramimonas_sp.AAC.1
MGNSPVGEGHQLCPQVPHRLMLKMHAKHARQTSALRPEPLYKHRRRSVLDNPRPPQSDH